MHLICLISAAFVLRGTSATGAADLRSQKGQNPRFLTASRGSSGISSVKVFPI